MKEVLEKWGHDSDVTGPLALSVLFITNVIYFGAKLCKSAELKFRRGQVCLGACTPGLGPQ